MSELPLRRPAVCKSMVIAITRDSVFMEIAELVRYKLCSVLKVSLGDVSCGIEWDAEKMKVVPSITVDPKATEGLTNEQVVEVIKSVWWLRKPMLEERLKDLGSVRARA